MTKKRETSLNSYNVHDTKENLRPKRGKYNTTIFEHPTPITDAQKSLNRGEDHPVKQWFAGRLKDKLQRATILSLHAHKPILLYRKSIEESENAVEEEIGYVSGNHIVQIIYTYGGFIPSSFQKIEVFTVDKFTKWILQERKKDLLLQCIEELEK